MANLRFNIRPVIIQGENLSSVISSDSDTAITYNNYYPIGTHVSTYQIEAKLALSNVTVHDDLSVSFDYGGIQSVRARTTWSSAAVGYNVNKHFYKGDGTVAWEQSSDIAAGNINLYGGTPDGQTLIRTHNGQAENDVTVGGMLQGV